MPESGNISVITLIRERLAIIRRQKDTVQEKLKEQEELIYRLQVEYKSANIEYEKIKYLEEQDYEAWVKKTKKQEQLDLDEIATMLFKSNK
jgi:flagellar biosynthesis chaperone FliJ